ncbi:YncE family protein [Acidicapsa acidisoli]|uniref:YncE family protein n=1 Tax=Acidicapsa acidisoli TaxID=1615681 RepID=UPI0021DF9443|nr:YncE family protein [Acidicapsa acidisoli]
MPCKPLVVAILTALLPFAALAQAQDNGAYKVLKIQLVGGGGGFDYVTADPDGRNLYVARSGPSGHIGVFNLDTLAQVGDIPGVSAHGGAVDTATGHGFATSKPVTMFDSKTFAILKKIDVQGNPDGYLNDAYNHRFYVLSHAEPNITVLDDKDGAILGTIDIGGAPEQAATDGHGRIYVDIEDKSAIAVIDANTMKMVGKYDVSSKGGGCAGLALDAKNNILFAACRENKNMIILSATDGHIITDLPIGAGSDGATFNPATMEAFSSQGDGTLTVVKEDSPTSFSVEQTVATPARAKVLTLDTKTSQILTITAEYGPVPATPPSTATPTVAGAGGPPQGAPAFMRGPRAPMIPNSFQILVIGK